MFADRAEAGRRLALLLKEYEGQPDAIVMGIPRGGVVVAAQVARALRLPLDVAITAKVGAPGSPEYAIGAVAADGVVSVNPGSGFSADEVTRLSGDALAKVDHLVRNLRGTSPALDLRGKTILLIDDGLATGLTALAACDWLHREGASHIVLAVPVASADAVAALRSHADRVISDLVPAGFMAVGAFYRRFGQTEDAEVTELLAASRVGGS